MSAAHRANKAPSHMVPRMSRGMAPARGNANRARPGKVPPVANVGPARANPAQPCGYHTVSRAAALSPNTYLYGSGGNARRYQAYGYGRGYRNRYSAGHWGYGRSQGNDRAIVSRLRSVHKALARLDHDYRGHRVRAMHHLAMAIRRLFHRAMSSGRGVVLASGTAARRTGPVGPDGNAGANGRRAHPLPQAQSDARMSLALRTTQGIALQMSHQGTDSAGHSRARGHLHQAIREMNTALAVR